MLEVCVDVIIGSHDCHRYDRTTKCRPKPGAREMGRLPRPEPPPILNCRMAEDHPAVRRLDRVQYLRCLLL